MNPRYFECNCSSSEHSIKFTFNNQEKECYLEVQLIKQSFLNRLVSAVKYLFGYKCKYGHWECTILGKQQVETLVVELSSFYRRNFSYDNGGKQKIMKALKEIGKGRKNTMFSPNTKNKKRGRIEKT